MNPPSLVKQRTCKITIFVGHGCNPDPNKGVGGTANNSGKSNDRVGTVGCGTKDENDKIGNGRGYPNPDRNNELSSGSGADGYQSLKSVVDSEIKAAKKEAEKLCEISSGLCCKNVKIQLFGADGDGTSWIEKNYNGNQNPTVAKTDCKKNCIKSGGSSLK